MHQHSCTHKFPPGADKFKILHFITRRLRRLFVPSVPVDVLSRRESFVDNIKWSVNLRRMLIGLVFWARGFMASCLPLNFPQTIKTLSPPGAAWTRQHLLLHSACLPQHARTDARWVRRKIKIQAAPPPSTCACVCVCVLGIHFLPSLPHVCLCVCVCVCVSSAGYLLVGHTLHWLIGTRPTSFIIITGGGGEREREGGGGGRGRAGGGVWKERKKQFLNGSRNRLMGWQ